MMNVNWMDDVRSKAISDHGVAFVHTIMQYSEGSNVYPSLCVLQYTTVGTVPTAVYKRLRFLSPWVELYVLEEIYRIPVFYHH